MEKYKVTITLEVEGGSIEATSPSDAEELVEYDVKNRFHKGAKVKVLSSVVTLEL